jgi:hypothetical protein
MAEDFRLSDSNGNDSIAVDGDTEYNFLTKKRERLAGFNTREVAHVDKDKYGKPIFVAPEVGAYSQTEAYAKMVKEGNFNYKVNTGNYTPDGREIIERYDPDGNSISDMMIATGAAEPNRYTSPEAMRAREEYLLEEQITGKPGKFSDIVDVVDNTINSAGINFKQVALNEAVYNPDLHTGVAFRDHARTLDNKGIGVLGQMGDSWDAGWIGVQEGLWGYLEGIGATTDIEMIENIGTQGVLRARDSLIKAPETILDYREVDGLLSGFQYTMNNAAMSAPYMVTTFASMAAAVPATLIGGPVLGALTFGLPNAMIYGGHAWNEMEGEKGAAQFAVATTVGVAAAVLDRFGLSKIFAPTQMLSKVGVAKVAKELAEKTGVTEAVASATLRNATREQQKELIKFIGTVGRLSPEDLARFNLAQVGKRGLAGAGIESATEMTQEGLQYGAAVGFSDKEYNSEQLFNRLINAGIAGGVLGGGLSAAGNVYTQGKQEVYRTAKAPGDQDRFRIMNQHRINVTQREGAPVSIEENIANQTAVQNDSRTKADAISAKERARAEVGSLTDTELKNIIEGSDAKGNQVTQIEDEIAYLENLAQVEKAKGGSTTNIEAKIAEKKIELREARRLRINAIQEVEDRNNGEQPLSQAEANGLKEKVRNLELARPTATRGLFAEKAAEWIATGRGLKNFITNLEGVSDFATKAGLGMLRLVQAAERSAISMSKLIQSPQLLDLFSRVGQLTTGVFHSGKNFKQYFDSLLEAYRKKMDEGFIIDALYGQTINSNNVIKASVEIRAFADNTNTTNGSAYQQYIAWLTIKDTGISWEAFYKKSKGQLDYTEEKANTLYLASMQVQASYQVLIDSINATLKEEDPSATLYTIDPDFWWKNRGFDFKTVRSKKAKFKAFLRKNGYSETQAEFLYQNIAYRGEAIYVKDYSLVGGETWFPPFLEPKLQALQDADPDGFAEFASENIFEPLNRAQSDAAKYVSVTKYFGHGGRKLDFLISEAIRANANADPNDPNALTEKDILQFAFYMKAIIDSTHGNFNTVEQPQWAAINRFLTSWSIFAGLPLATLSSIPETAMIYYGLQDDSEWKMASDNLIKQLAGSWDAAAKAELKRIAELTDRSGIPVNANTIADRVSTGQRDIAFAKAHEVFFNYIQIKTFTQFQRRMNAAMAIDFVKSRAGILLDAPRLGSLFRVVKDKDQSYADVFNEIDIIDTEEIEFRFDFGSMNNEELEAYNSLADLGLDVERLVKILLDTDELYRDNIFIPTNSKNNPSNYLLPPTPKQAAVLSAFQNSREGLGTTEDKVIISKAQDLENEINEQLETAVYRFVNERIQNPQAANRPLFFQDPHYQLLTQFNGFISTFTAVVIPKLWNNYLRKGNPQIKYNTFALVVTMIALGSASQYIKDLLKFGGPSPYLDTVGYTQRAVYSSGVLGQYERVLDTISPLYPDRSDNWLMGAITGAGPSTRNIANAAEALGLALQGDQGDRAITKALGVTPLIAPFTGARQVAGKVLTGQDAIDNTAFQGSSAQWLLNQLTN